MRRTLLGMALSAFLLAGCSDEASSVSVEQDASADAQQEIVVEVPQVQISAHLKEGKVFFLGQTNLPENTKIGVQVVQEESSYSAQDYRIFVSSDGSFTSTGFTNKGDALSGRIAVNVFFYNSTTWQSEEVIRQLVDKHGLPLEKDFNLDLLFDLGGEKASQTDIAEAIEKLNTRSNELWVGLNELRYSEEFHTFGYAQGAGFSWLRKQEKLLGDWEVVSKDLTIVEKLNYDIQQTASYMRMVGNDWAVNRGKTPTGAVQMVKMIEASISRGGLAAIN